MKKSVITIWMLRAAMTLAVLLKIGKGEYGLVAYGSLAILITFFPEIAEAVFKLRLAMHLRVILTTFVFFAMTVGKLCNLYEITSWWDKLLHLGSGAILAYAGVLIARSENENGGNHRLILLFGLFFSIACGAIWEIWEFSGDVLFGLDSQIRATGVVDTMSDIIADTIGAILVLPFLWRGQNAKSSK